MNNELKIKGWKEKISDLDKQLDSPTLKRDWVTGSVEESLPISNANLNATFTASGGASIEIYNSADDVDPDGVIGKSTANNDGLVLNPQITFDPNQAWLKYKVGGNLKAEAGASLGDLGFKLDLEAGMDTSAYRIHLPSAKLGETVGQDLTRPRFIFSKEDIKELVPNEALSLRVRGSFGLGLTLDWADIFSTQANLLGKLIDPNHVFAIKFGASASVSMKVSVEDTYFLIISRASNDLLRVALKKADKNSLTATVGAKIVAQFADPDAVKAMLDGAVSGLLDAPLAKLNEIMNTLSLDQLSPEQKKLAEMVLERLGLDPHLDDLEAWKEKLAAFLEKVSGTIEEVAKAKAELAFTYEYSRVHSDETVLQATMKLALLNDYHHDLLKGNLDKITKDLAASRDGLTLERFLNQKTLKVAHAYGFSLSLLGWSAKSKDHRSMTKTTRRNINGQEQVSYHGVRGYDSQWGKDKAHWQIDFNAAMKGFSAVPGSAKANEFDYGFSISLQDLENKTEGNELTAFVDLGVIWGAISGAEREEMTAKLAGLKAKNGVTYKFELLFPPAVFRAMLPLLAQEQLDQIAWALAKAMPYTERYIPVTADPAGRAKAYAPLWKDYLLYGTKGSEMALKAKNHLKSVNKALAHFEGDHWRTARTTSIAGIIELNGAGVDRRGSSTGTRLHWTEFLGGCRDLYNAINQGKDDEAIADAFSRIRGLGGTAHHVRALGVYLLSIAALIPGLASEITSTLTISEGEEIQVISQS